MQTAVIATGTTDVPTVSLINKPVLVLRKDKVDELCKTHGVKSLGDLAGKIGVSRSTLWRIDEEITFPSAGLIAQLKVAFPLISFDELIEVRL